MKYRAYWLVALAVFGQAFAADPCEKLTPVKNPTGYREREPGVRCEGFYVAKVSRSRQLTLVGLTRGRLEFGERDSLTIESPLPNLKVRVRGVGIPAKTYYRLDGVIPPGKNFVWPLSEIVKRKHLRADDIGLIGFHGSRGGDETIYVPLDVGGGRQTILRIIGAERFASVSWRMAFWQGNYCAAMPEKWRKLDPPRFKDEPVEIPLGQDISRNLCVEVAAQPMEGDDWRMASWKIQVRP